MQSAPVAPTMVANPGPTTNPAAGEKHYFSRFIKKKTALCQKFTVFWTHNKIVKMQRHITFET